VIVAPAPSQVMPYIQFGRLPLESSGWHTVQGIAVQYGQTADRPHQAVLWAPTFSVVTLMPARTGRRRIGLALDLGANLGVEWERGWGAPSPAPRAVANAFGGVSVDWARRVRAGTE
jgi:hypothetical protein